MKIRALLFICCTSFMVSAVSAQKQTGTDTPKETIHIVKMDKRVSELMADRVTIRKDMGLKELAEINARVDESLAANEALLQMNYTDQTGTPVGLILSVEELRLKCLIPVL